MATKSSGIPWIAINNLLQSVLQLQSRRIMQYHRIILIATLARYCMTAPSSTRERFSQRHIHSARKHNYECVEAKLKPCRRMRVCAARRHFERAACVASIIPDQSPEPTPTSSWKIKAMHYKPMVQEWLALCPSATCEDYRARHRSCSAQLRYKRLRGV